MTMPKVLMPLIALVFIAFAVPVQAFECPRAQPVAKPGVLRETATEQQALAQFLAAGDVENKVGLVVNDLRRKYPAVDTTELVNYLVGAYCPGVAANTGLSDAEKAARVDRFSQLVFEALARP